MIMLACASPIAGQSADFNTWTINHKRLKVSQLGSVRTGEQSFWVAIAIAVANRWLQLKV